MRVLIIDESETAVRLLLHDVRGLHMDVESAGSLDAACDVIARQAPDVVLLDPARLGADAARVVAKVRLATVAPILICASRPDSDLAVISRYAGANGFVQKGAKRSALEAAILVALKSKHP